MNIHSLGGLWVRFTGYNPLTVTKLVPTQGRLVTKLVPTQGILVIKLVPTDWLSLAIISYDKMVTGRYYEQGDNKIT